MAVLKSTPSPLNEKYGDLLKALSERPRRIPSKYFYDDEGSRLFEQITEQADYYPTRCEEEILRSQSRDILIACGMPPRLNIIELGAGDGRKTKFLLNEATRGRHEINYRPVDISQQALNDLANTFARECPDVKIEPVVLDLDQEMDRLPLADDRPNLVLYLGSSLGNLLPEQQRHFLNQVHERLHPGDFMLTGFDLKKDAAILQRAYDDRAGVTREFNMNLLRRLNRDLDSDFREARFSHQAAYNPATGAMESWLVSKEDQTVHLRGIGLEMRLDAYEALHVETSWKFSPREIRDLAANTGFRRVGSFYDQRSWFVDELWIKAGNDR